MVQTTPVLNPNLQQLPSSSSLEAERHNRKEELADAFRVFARCGFADRLAGHITVRDPELSDHF